MPLRPNAPSPRALTTWIGITQVTQVAARIRIERRQTYWVPEQRRAGGVGNRLGEPRAFYATCITARQLKLLTCVES